MRKRGLDIQYKAPAEVARMREAGLVVAAALAACRAAVAPGVSTADLDALAEKVIRDAGAVPSFKGYFDFPATICAAVNAEVVHGIPDPGRVLRQGDVISIDCGAIVDGWHGDAAITAPVGEVDPAVLTMAEVAQDAMWAGITAGARAVRAGGGRLTDISHAVEREIRRRDPGRGRRRRYGIVTAWGGHGIGTAMHQDPPLPNVGPAGRGPALVPGLVLAIEPMLTLGTHRVRELADGWTVVTRDRSVAVHVEHTFALLEDGAWVLTAEDGGAGRLGDLLTARA